MRDEQSHTYTDYSCKEYEEVRIYKKPVRSFQNWKEIKEKENGEKMGIKIVFLQIHAHVFFICAVFIFRIVCCCLPVIMWFLFGEVSSYSGFLGWATLFYCGTP